MKKTKEVLTAFLAVLLILAMPLSVSATEYNDFSDVKENAWFYPAVRYAVEHDLFHGTGNGAFSPNVPMTRGMFVTVLGNLSGVNKADYTVSYFRDVQMNRYFAPFVQWAANYGVVKGVGHYRFNPDGGISRQEMAVMLYQFAKMTGNDTTWEEIPEDRFSDVGDVSGWASEAVKWAVTHGLLNGAGGMLLPKNGATRAQVAQVFMNAENLLTKTTPITDPLELEVPPVVFTPVAMEKLNNYAVFASKMTPDQFKQVYDICVELVRPAAGLTKEQQLYYVAKAVNLEYQLTTYDDTTEHYGDPYGVLIEKRATCSGCTRTVGLCLNILGFSYEHVNEGEWTHQWARVKVGDIYWVVDGDGFGMCYKELAPYEHSDFIDMNQVVSPEMPTLKAAVRVSVGDYSFEKTVDVAAEGSSSWGSDGKEVSIHLPDELGNEISLDSWDTPIKLNIDVSEGVGPFVIGELQDRTILERSEEKTLHAECVIPEKWLQRVRDDGTLELSFVTYDVFGNNIFVTLLVKP